jgi:hypothetical protein
MHSRFLVRALLLALLAELAGCATTQPATPTPAAYAYRSQRVQRRAMSSSDMDAIRAQIAAAEAAAAQLTPRT